MCMLQTRLKPDRLELANSDSEERLEQNMVHKVAFSPDSTLLAAASDDMKIRVGAMLSSSVCCC